MKIPILNLPGLDIGVSPKVFTDEQIRALLTTPLNLVETLSGKKTIPWFAVITIDTTAGAYTIDGTALLQIVAAGESRLGEVLAPSYPLLSDGQSDKVTTILSLTQLDGGYSELSSVFDGSSIELALSGSATSITDGHPDNTLSVVLIYVQMDS